MILTTEAKVGLVTLIGLIMLIMMSIYIGNFNLSSDNGYKVEAVFSQVSGLKTGSPVRYAGVDIGRVNSMEASDEGVKVELIIQSGFKIPKDARFTITAEGFMGEKFIQIIPGAAKKETTYLAPGEQVWGESYQGMEEVLAEVHKLTKSLNDVLGDEKVKTALKDAALNSKKITDNIAALSESLARMANTNEKDIRLMVMNLAEMSNSLKNVSARVDNLFASLDNNGQTAEDLKATLSSMKNASASIEKMAVALEGVVTDPKMSQDIKETMANAKEVSKKANKILSTVEEINTEANIEVLYGQEGKHKDKYLTNADVKIGNKDTFAILGATDIGEENKLKFQLGKNNGSYDIRLGVMEGKAGLGSDAKLTDNLKISLDLYNPNNFTWKLRTQYEAFPDTYLVGQVNRAKEDNNTNTYFGVRKGF